MAFRGAVQINHDRTDDEDDFFPTKRNKAISNTLGKVKAGDSARPKRKVPGGHGEAGNEEDLYPEIGRNDPDGQAAEGSEDSGGTTYEDEEGQSAGYTPEPTSDMEEDEEPKRPLRLTDRNRDHDVTPEEEHRSGMSPGGERTRIGNPKRAMRGTGGHAEPPLGGRERYDQLRETDDMDSSATEGLPRSNRPREGTAGTEGLPRARNPMQDGTQISGSHDIGFEANEGHTDPPEHGGSSRLGNPRKPMMGTGGHAKPPLGSGARFASLKAKLAKRPGVTNPAALAASIGRKKYGAGKMSKMAAKNR